MNSGLIKKNFSFFKNENNKDVVVEVYFYNQNIWLSQKLMSLLFDIDVKTINEHLKNIFESNELEKSSTIWNFQIVQKEVEEKASFEYEIFNKKQFIESDFVRVSKKYLGDKQNV